MYLNKKEDQKNYLQIRNDYQNRQVEKYLRKFRNTIRSLKFRNKNPLKQGIEGHQKFSPIIIYSHYLERVLTEENQEIGKLNKQKKFRLRRLIK